MTTHLWYRNRELVACGHAVRTAGLALTREDLPGTSPGIGQGLDEDPSGVTCRDCLCVGHYRTRAAAAAALARLRVGEAIAHDDPRIVPVRSQLLQVGTPLDAFRLELGSAGRWSTCQIPGCTRLLAEASELEGARVPAETLASLPAADAERASLVNRRIELERQGLCYVCADQQAQGNPPVGEHLWLEGVCARCCGRASLANNTPCAWRPSSSVNAQSDIVRLAQETRARAAQVISLTVDVTDPARPTYHASCPVGLRPPQLAAGRAALAALARVLDERLKEAQEDEPAAPPPEGSTP